MTVKTSLDPRYSDPAGESVDWEAAQQRVVDAQVAWLVTVRPDGRPHTTPLVPVWHEGRAYFHTGEHEQKYTNLQANPHVLVLAGDTRWDEGLDVVIEGDAHRVEDESLLATIAARYADRWDGRWILVAHDGRLSDPDLDGDSVLFEVIPTTAYGHAKGDPFGQTTYRFRQD
ncbi:MAG TPA: pyridoxamine 5'-phosphate oxidase family protein [Marmoricola sp.]|jgi:general stress protein 26|nr:pyridoxamine 5'-phosphate oxidase family protein [Marmoricola sp.]